MGKPHDYSDIELAIWINNFPNKHYTDIPAIAKIVSFFNPIRPQFYSNEDTGSTDPYIEMIEMRGKIFKREK